jgi:hypothetical protein
MRYTLAVPISTYGAGPARNVTRLVVERAHSPSSNARRKSASSGRLGYFWRALVARPDEDRAGIESAHTRSGLWLINAMP